MQEFSEYWTSETIDSQYQSRRETFISHLRFVIDVYLILISGLVVSENVDFWIPQKK